MDMSNPALRTELARMLSDFAMRGISKGSQT